ncbi:F-box/WD repeat-containing protein 7 [Bradysia coprophila]|uniref:F-box/WD repeat-containing protein 7 n=1 Tax=Bradysia coprophila TaxID=38358 RepID=UPI00187DA5DC|nr:F-box/WD repeat-containing protein 7 [Bradysia coprophila]
MFSLVSLICAVYNLVKHYMKRMAEKCISTIKESSVICDRLYANTKESIVSDETTPRCDQKCDSSCSGTPSTTTVPPIMHIALHDAITNLNDTTSPDISYARNTPSTMVHYMSDECEAKNGQAFANCEKVDVYLETPVVDDNNESFGASTTTNTTNAASKHSINIVPKRLSDEFYSADDCYSDNEDVRSSVTLIEYNDSLVQVDEKSITPNSNVESSAEMSRFEENSIDNIIDSTYNEDEISSCSNLIDIRNDHDESSPHSTASPGIQDNGEEANHGDEHLMDNVIYYDSEMQSVDGVDRKQFELKEKLADAMILRTGSLVSGDNRLNIGLLNTFSQKIDQDCSPVDELNIDQNSISTTPTSSRTKTMRFGNAKTTAKLNLSESLEKLDVADKQALSESDYINKTRNSVENNSSKLGGTDGDQSPIRIKLLQQHSQMDSFLNSNSNDSLLSYQFSEKKCGNNSESSQSTTATQTSSSTTNNCDENLTSNHLAIASTSKAAQSSDSSDCTVSNSNEMDDVTKGCSVDNCMMIDDESGIKQEVIEEEIVIADNDSKQPFDLNLPSSSSSQRMSLVNNQQIDETNFDQSHALMGLENDHDYEEDTWADCEEMSDVEEVCTCRDYSDEDIHGNSEDELPSRDVDLSYYAHLDTLSEDILPENANGDSTPKNQRKRKLTDTLSHDGSTCGDGTPGNRKRLALDSVTSPKVLLTPTTPTLIATSPTTHGLVLSDKRTPRLLIPTRDHPPPELSDWLLQFQRWTNAERLLAVDQLIEHCEPTQVRHMMKVIEPHFQRDFISLLPRELALHVLSYLEPKVLLRAAQTCRSWRFLCDDNLLWKEKCKKTAIVIEPTTDRPKRGRAGNMPPISSQWKAAYMRQHIIEMNWRTRPIREPKVLKGHDDHVITCLQFCGNRIVSGSDDNTLKVWSAVTGKCLRTLSGHTGGVWSSQMSGSTIISGSTDRTLKVWDADSGQCKHTLYGHTSTVRCMHLHGNKVVSGSRDATLRVWDIVQGKFLHILVGHLAAVRCVQYDGKLVVSGAYDNMVKVWNPETQECLHTLQGHTNRVYSLQFDGIHVVSGSLDTSIRVWDAETGSCKHILMGHQSLTSGMELRQNILVSGNADSTVKVWDITNGQCLQTLSGPNKHQSAVTCLQFNSRFVITSSDDGTVKLWDVKTGEFIRNLVSLDSGGSGGVVWRIRANDTKLICAVGSRNGTEETKLMVLDFDVEGACLKCS